MLNGGGGWVLDITWLLQLDGWKCEGWHWGAMYIVFEVVGGQGRDKETL